jgi:hypothetical protein
MTRLAWFANQRTVWRKRSEYWRQTLPRNSHHRIATAVNPRPARTSFHEAPVARLHREHPPLAAGSANRERPVPTCRGAAPAGRSRFRIRWGAPLLEFTTVQVQPGTASAFEAKLRAGQPSLKEETLWYRLVTGGELPKYLRLRPRPRMSAMLEGADDLVLSQANGMITRATVELLVSDPGLTIDIGGH